MGYYKNWLDKRELRENIHPLSGQETLESMLKRLTPVDKMRFNQFIQAGQRTRQEIEKFVRDLISKKGVGSPLRLPTGLPAPPAPPGQGWQKIPNMVAPRPPKTV